MPEGLDPESEFLLARKSPGRGGSGPRMLEVVATRFRKVMDRDENRAKPQNSTTLTLLPMLTAPRG